MSRHSPFHIALFLLSTSACGGDDAAPTTGTVTAGSPSIGVPAGAGKGGSGAATAGKSGATAGKSGASAGGATAAGGTGSSAGTGGKPAATGERFSFFVTSLKAMQELSRNQHGFGGDLRFGETGEGAGLRGADKICTTIAEQSMPGAGKKQWRAFLSATRGGANGGPVHAIDRIGEGPWYDRLGRLLANNKSDLMQVRPANADPAIKNDLPNELGVPNHNPDGTGEVDNHDVLTGTNDKGQLYRNDPHVTCNDWTNSVPDVADAPRVGHSWPRSFGPGGGGGRPGRPGGGRGDRALLAGSSAPSAAGRSGGSTPIPPPGGGGDFGSFNGENWMSALDESGCGAEASIIEMGPPDEQNPTVGSGGGYGGIYCFALTP